MSLVSSNWLQVWIRSRKLRLIFWCWFSFPVIFLSGRNSRKSPGKRSSSLRRFFFILKNLVTFEDAFPTSMNIPAASEMTLFFFFLHSLSLSLAFFFFRLFLFLLLARFFSSFHHKLGFWKILLSLFFVIIVVGWPSARFLSKFQFNVTFNCYETTWNFEWFWESWNNRRERLRKIPGKLD